MKGATRTTKAAEKKVLSGKPAAQHVQNSSPGRSRLVGLQQTIGNRVLSGFFGGHAVQPKLTIGSPNDRFELEADGVADQVMQMPTPPPTPITAASPADPRIQRLCPACEQEMQRRPLPNISRITTSSAIQRVCPQCEEAIQRQTEEEEFDERVQRQPEDEDELVQSTGIGSQKQQLTDDTSNRINAVRNGGQPLPESARAFFEPRFGRDFGHVRVHTDTSAAKSAQEVSALAFTVGRNIVFGQGRYSPETNAGKKLLAHELVHTVQQGQGKQNVHVQRACMPGPIAKVVGTRSACTDNFDNTFVAGRLFKSNVNCDTFAPGQEAALVTFAKGQPAGTTFEVHGYASTDGSPSFNQDLGCARAMAAHKKLTDAPAVGGGGGAGVAAACVTGVVNHGPVMGPMASRRGVVIKETTAPPVIVIVPTNIRAANTHATASNRIPPRKNTPVNITIGGLNACTGPVKVSVKNGSATNGRATINGAASVNLAATATVNLKGTTQTTKGNAGNLKLVAEHGGIVVDDSDGFSVAAIPTDFSVTFHSTKKDPGWRRMLVNNHHKSDSGKLADLDQAQRREQVQYDAGTGTLAGLAGGSSGYFPANVSPRTDRHSTPTNRMKSPGGKLIAEQVFIYKCDRTGDLNIPVNNSGFRLTRHVFENPPASGTWDVRMSKVGTATTANGFKTGAASGSVIKVLSV